MKAPQTQSRAPLPHERLLLAWPRSAELWEGEAALAAARDAISRFAKIASRFLPVTVLTADGKTDMQAAGALAGLPGVERRVLAYDDIWLRDTGPIWAPWGPADRPVVARFDGWGGKFPHAHDAQLARRLLDLWGLEAEVFDGVAEGGGVLVSNQGVGLTTHEWLDARGHRVKALKAFGAERWLVLAHGLVDDHTDGHVDLVARFTDAGDVVACVADRTDETQFARLEGNLRQLEKAHQEGHVGRVWPLPLPADRSLAGGVRPPRSYANFLAVPGGLLVPTFDDPRDTEALDLLQAAFPGREVVGVNATGLVAGGGALHCCSLLIPEGVAL